MRCARIADPELRKQCRREADVDLGVKLIRFPLDHPGVTLCKPWSWIGRVLEAAVFLDPTMPFTPGFGPGAHVK
jgi:hypothetical protein